MTRCRRCGHDDEEPTRTPVWYDTGADWDRPAVDTPIVWDDPPATDLLGANGQPLRPRPPMGFGPPPLAVEDE